MDIQLMRKLQAKKPRLTDLCDGIAYKQMTPTAVINVIEDLLTTLGPLFPPGFKFEKITIPTPRQYFTEMCKLPRRPQTYDLSHTDAFMIWVHFSLDGHALPPRPKLLPIVRRGNRIMVWDTEYMISAVAADNIFSTSGNEIFIPFEGSRDNFLSRPVTFNLDGYPVYTTTVYSTLHKCPDAKNKRPNLFTYICANHGVTGAFKRFFNIDVKVGQMDPDTLDSTVWAFCTAGGTKQKRGVQVSDSLSEIAIAVKREDITPAVLSSIGAFFYSIENASRQIMIEVDEIDNRLQWIRILSAFIFKPTDPVKTFRRTEEHLQSLKTYITPSIKRRLLVEGISVEDIDDLMMYLIHEFNNIVTAQHPADVSKKKLITTRYVMYNITSQIVCMAYELKKIGQNGLSQNKCRRALDKFWKVDDIARIRSGHGEVRMFSSPNDCLLFNSTLHVVSQEIASGVTGGTVNMKSPQMKAHASIASRFSYELVNKSNPTAMTRLNPFIEVDVEGNVRISKDLDRIIRETQPFLEGVYDANEVSD